MEVSKKNDFEWELPKIADVHIALIKLGVLKKLEQKGYHRQVHFSENRMSRGNFNKFPESYQLLVEIVLMLWADGKIKITSDGKVSRLIRDAIFAIFGNVSRSRFQHTLAPTMVIVKAFDIISQLKSKTPISDRLFDDEKVEAHNERSRKLNRKLLNLPLLVHSADHINSIWLHLISLANKGDYRRQIGEYLSSNDVLYGKSLGA